MNCLRSCDDRRPNMAQGARARAVRAGIRDNEITAVLPELTEADFKELGLPLGPRKQLFKAIASLPGRLPAEPAHTSEPFPARLSWRLTIRRCRVATSTGVTSLRTASGPKLRAAVTVDHRSLAASANVFAISTGMPK
jgi:hypothetical protein